MIDDQHAAKGHVKPAAEAQSGAPGQGILKGLRVVEGSAFVAAPLGGMTLAQLGAEVIRFDPIGGGLDHQRWPVTRDGKHSLFWAGLNKGKRSIAVDFRVPRGQELLTALICAPGEHAGLFSTNFPATGWLDYDALRKRRADLVMVNLTGRRDGSSEVDYTLTPQVGLPMMTGPTTSPEMVNHVFPAWDFIAGQMIAIRPVDSTLVDPAIPTIEQTAPPLDEAMPPVVSATLHLTGNGWDVHGTIDATLCTELNWFIPCE